MGSTRFGIDFNEDHKSPFRNTEREPRSATMIGTQATTGKRLRNVVGADGTGGGFS